MIFLLDIFLQMNIMILALGWLECQKGIMSVYGAQLRSFGAELRKRAKLNLI